MGRRRALRIEGRAWFVVGVCVSAASCGGRTLEDGPANGETGGSKASGAAAGNPSAGGSPGGLAAGGALVGGRPAGGSGTGSFPGEFEFSGGSGGGVDPPLGSGGSDAIELPVEIKGLDFLGPVFEFSEMTLGQQMSLALSDDGERALLVRGVGGNVEAWRWFDAQWKRVSVAASPYGKPFSGWTSIWLSPSGKGGWFGYSTESPYSYDEPQWLAFEELAQGELAPSEGRFSVDLGYPTFAPAIPSASRVRGVELDRTGQFAILATNEDVEVWSGNGWQRQVWVSDSRSDPLVLDAAVDRVGLLRQNQGGGLVVRIWEAGTWTEATLFGGGGPLSEEPVPRQLLLADESSVAFATWHLPGPEGGSEFVSRRDETGMWSNWDFLPDSLAPFAPLLASSARGDVAFLVMKDCCRTGSSISVAWFEGDEVRTSDVESELLGGVSCTMVGSAALSADGEVGVFAAVCDLKAYYFYSKARGPFQAVPIPTLGNQVVGSWPKITLSASGNRSLAAWPVHLDGSLYGPALQVSVFAL